MPFRGISIDDEGSIIYDGEKFIVNNLSKVPDDFNPGDKPVVGLPKTHPSHPQNRKPSSAPKYVLPPVIYTAFDNKRAEEHKEHVQEASGSHESEEREKRRETGSNKPSLSGFPQDMEWQPDISALGLVNFVDVPGNSIDPADMEFYLAARHNPVVHEVQIAIQCEGIPPAFQGDPERYLRLCGEYGIDEENDAEARAYLDYIMYGKPSLSSLNDLNTVGSEQFQANTPRTGALFVTNTPYSLTTPTTQPTSTPSPTPMSATLFVTNTPHFTATPTATWIPTSTLIPSEAYVLQSFVVDESVVVNEPFDKSLGIELTLYGAKWVDSSKKGLLSRDFNPIGGIDPFRVQTPVIGPDVRVELVSKEGPDDRGLGNYVVISFPASVYQTHEEIMQRLANDPNHNPDQWREDGRIFIGFGHLSVIEGHIQPGIFINSEDKAIIGTTGNTGTQKRKDNPEDEEINRHLDLSLAYFGSPSSDGRGMVETTNLMRSSPDCVDCYIAFAERSNLFPDNNVFTVHGENLDPVRVWPELDELGQAQDEKGKRIYDRE